MLTEKQLKLIEYLVDGEMTISDALKKAGVPRTTYYHWRKNPDSEFMRTLNETTEITVNNAKQSIRTNVERYIKQLDRIAMQSPNEQAKVNAIAKLFTLAELDPTFKQEVTINKDESESKNYLLDMLKKEKE